MALSVVLAVAVWDAADWRAYRDERAGVAEFDGGLNRHEAEARAFECCLSEWLCQNFQTNEPGHCSECGVVESDSDRLLPYGDAINGHTWLHSECWPAWYAHRRHAAIAALKAVDDLFKDEGVVLR
jgi:hypothetical protein